VSKKRDLLEAGIACILILLYIWIENRWIIALAVPLLLKDWVIGLCTQKTTLRNLGLIHWKYVAVAGLTILGKHFFGRYCAHLTGIPRISLFLVGYFGWATIQMFLLLEFFSKRIEKAGASTGQTATWTGIIFLLCHMPNPVLMPITYAGGTAASYFYSRMKRKNLYLFAIAHLTIAAIVYFTVPAFLHHNFRIGPSFSRWHPPIQ